MPSFHRFFSSGPWAAVLSLALGASCVSQTPPPASHGAQLRISQADARKIGRKIWINECGGTVAGLTSWNRSENFPSLGIGHFIWYPPGVEGPFEESFPKFIAFAKNRGANMPAWLENTKDSPWTTRAEFQAAQDSERMTELRQFLAGTIDLQTDFIVDRLRQALPKMKKAAPNPAARDRLERNFYALAAQPNGVYALIDYVNFKGEGTNPNERYKGQGWGLAQVLMEMEGDPTPAAFSEAAKRVLRRRIANAPREESQWLNGWMNRCETYKRPL